MSEDQIQQHHAVLITICFALALVIFPIVVVFVGAMGRKLVRGGKFKGLDFCVGPDLTLTAVSVGAVNFLDLSREALQNHQFEIDTIIYSAGFLIFSFAAFALIMGLHQWCEPLDNQKGKQAFWLGIVSNGLGLFLLVVFMLLKIRRLV